MRTALFSDKEREMIEHYLKTGEWGKGVRARGRFRLLAHRVGKFQKLLKEDFDLMTKFLTKLKLDPP